MFGGWEGRRPHAFKFYVRCLLGQRLLCACSFERIVHMELTPVELQSFVVRDPHHGGIGRHLSVLPSS